MMAVEIDMQVRGQTEEVMALLGVKASDLMKAPVRFGDLEFRVVDAHFEREANIGWAGPWYANLSLRRLIPVNHG